MFNKNNGELMQLILSSAIIVVLLTSLIIVLRWGRLKVIGPMPVGLFTFIAILFTSGLDVGLIMFPMTEFPVYATEPAYSFVNPLAFMFGVWGFLIWVFYFLTTFYFCVVEPKLKIFEIPAVKIVNNIVIIGTCAFTGLRVVDSSMFPAITNGNLNAPTIMVAEKMADSILGISPNQKNM